MILDNYAAHKHPKVRQWLDRHPRFTFHFTPTSCSWLNAVEVFFAKLAKRRLNRHDRHHGQPAADRPEHRALDPAADRAGRARRFTRAVR